MSDDAMLRLAELVAHLTCDVYANGDDRIARAAQLVRDLEAAQKVHETRTITRAQFQAALSAIELEHGTSKAWHNDAVRIIAAAWRLTVEDA